MPSFEHKWILQHDGQNAKVRFTFPKVLDLFCFVPRLASVIPSLIKVKRTPLLLRDKEQVRAFLGKRLFVKPAQQSFGQGKVPARGREQPASSELFDEYRR